MVEKAILMPDVTADLQAESLRLTAFLAPSVEIGEPAWWAGLTGFQPETKTSKPSRGELQEAGPFGDGTLVLSSQPSRVDWFLGPRLEDGIPKDSRFAGRFNEVFPVFIPLMRRWLTNGPGLLRLAFGAILHRPVQNRADAYTRLAQSLPALQIDIEHSEDLIYQINRPRDSVVVPKLKVNRLSKWSTALLIGFQLDFSKPLVHQRMSGGEFTCRFEFDINSDGRNTQVLPQAQVPDLFEELTKLALELAVKGDIP
jgi:hypothetical protein